MAVWSANCSGLASHMLLASRLHKSDLSASTSGLAFHMLLASCLHKSDHETLACCWRSAEKSYALLMSYTIFRI